MRVSLAEAIDLLQQGKIVAIPTDTVYGLAASAIDTRAIAQIFAMKKRPLSSPLIIQVAERTQINAYGTEYPPFFDALTDRFWPGALSLVLPVDEEKVPSIVRAGLPTAGFRIANHPLTLDFLRAAGPCVVPSANLSGSFSSTCAEHVEADFGPNLPLLDGGACTHGVESTLLAFQEERWVILRSGAITAEELSTVLGYKPIRLPPKAKKNSQRLVIGTLPYDGGIPCVIGFSDRNYSGAKRIWHWGTTHDDPQLLLQHFYGVLRQAAEEKEIWIDARFCDDGDYHILRQHLENWNQDTRL